MSCNPFPIIEAWLAEAKLSEPNDANAMALATVSADGAPAVRMVLLKEHGPEGFVFYTNQASHKADDLRSTPRAALLLHWKSLRRQIRINGPVSTVSDTQADAYFASRSRDSQLGAWASDQSRPLPDRATFEQRFAAVQARYAGQDVPRPPYWSGYFVVPEQIELWEDRPHRLHHRLLFTRIGNVWQEGLLYP